MVWLRKGIWDIPTSSDITGGPVVAMVDDTNFFVFWVGKAVYQGNLTYGLWRDKGTTTGHESTDLVDAGGELVLLSSDIEANSFIAKVEQTETGHFGVFLGVAAPPVVA